MRSNKTFAGLSLIATLLVQELAAGTSPCTQAISRDVVVVGGGAAGAHAAVWLRDNGKTVVVVEKASQLGGHTAFYDDPDTGQIINVGVQAWMEYEDAFDFPKRMNVSTSGSMQFTANDNKWIDFKTGLPVEGYVAPGAEDLYPALQKYLDVLELYEEFLLPSYSHFPKPDAIPEDLLMPFRKFVEKYDIEAAVPQIWDSTAQGLGDTMGVPAFWVMQASTAPMVRALLGTAAAAVPASGRLYDLYDSVAKLLGDDVLYSSMVASATRDDKDGVSLTVHNTDGKVTCIEAKRLLIAFEPTAENLEPFDIDATEKEVFDHFKYSTVYAGIIRHPSLQISTAYSNRSPHSGSSNYTVFPTASQVGRIDYIGGTADLFQFTAIGTEDETAEGMKGLIAQTIDTMIEAGTIPASNGTLTFAAFASHGKMHPHFTAEVILNGLIQKQVALQGCRSTWYTGSAFSAPFSTVLWEYNKVLLPNVIKGM